MRRVSSVLFILLAACGGTGLPEEGAPEVEIGEIGVSLTAPGISAFVLSGLFKAWPHKTERRDARQEHKLATTYYNRLLLTSRSNGGTLAPKGAMAISEDDLDGDAITDGYSVSIKIEDQAGAGSWLWWQARVPNLDVPLAFARANPDCERCHSAGIDRILTTMFPNY